MTEANRRSILAAAPLADRFPDHINAVPFPVRLETVDSLLSVYLEEIRQPATVVFVLDTSGSMDGHGMDTLKSVSRQLTGVDPLHASGFATYRSSEDITLVTFSTSVDEVEHFTINDADATAPSMLEVRDYVDGLVAGGNSAVYSGLDRAFQEIGQQRLGHPDRENSIVLITDGQSNDGISAQSFMYIYNALPQETQAAQVFPILVGDRTQDDDVDFIAEVTGSRVYGDTAADLAEIFKRIRGFN
jgi:Ca-activated chloride channel family protein